MRAWQQFVQEQEKQLGQEIAKAWLYPLKIIRFDACNLYLEAQDSFQALWFEEHMRPKLKTFCNNNLHPIKVHIVVRGQKTLPKQAHPKDKKAYISPFSLSFDGLDPSYTFAELIKTPKNALTISFIEELCDKLGHRQSNMLSQGAPNPIYVWGPQGGGKTHLLQAVASRLAEMKLKVIYAKSELFCDHMVKAIRAENMAQFRHIYRQADAMIIDDVQQLGKKSATQEEFFHTFNTLHSAGKLIILASSVYPQNLQNIESRLISRFEWGIALKMETPEKKEQMALLEKRAAFFHFPAPKWLLEFFTETFSSGAKAQVSALQTLVLRSRLESSALSVAGVKTVLADIIEQEKKNQITPEEIVATVSEQYGVPIEDIFGKAQNRETTIPRQISMFLCRQLLKMPYMTIGDKFSRDHSTVMSAVRHIDSLLEKNNGDIRGALLAVEQKLSKRSKLA